MTDTTAGEGVYRKTATIKATQWFKMGDHPAVILKSAPNRYADEGVPWVDTLEGGHVVTPGDWIATGVQGEHWPIKPDVFAATYACASVPSTKEEYERLGRSVAEPVSPLTTGLHPKTTELVNSFAIALAHKLLSAEEKYGYSDGWLTDDWEEKCRADLMAHVQKGDPVDVAAYAAFCWARSWSTAPSHLAAQPSAGAQGEAVAWRVEYRMPNGLMAGTSLFGSKAAADFTRSEATLETTLTPLYATPAQPDTGDVAALREALVRELDHLIMHIVAIGPDDPKKKGTDREYEIPMARRVWREVAIDAIFAALSKPNAPGREG